MLLGLVLASAAALFISSSDPTPPTTDKRPVTDVYHGVEVIDNYRWLEDWNDAAVRDWSEAQNAYARAMLDRLPGAEPIRARVEAVLTAPSVRHYDVHKAGSRLLAMRRESGRQQPMLVAFDDAAAVLADQPVEPRILFDPATLPGGATIDWYVPSPSGELVAVSVSLSGTESGDVRVLKVADGSPTGEVVPRVNGGTAGGSLAWTPDSEGFHYTRYPRTGERPEEDMDFYVKVYFHRVGTSTAEDRYEIGGVLPRKFTFERKNVDGHFVGRADASATPDLEPLMTRNSPHTTQPRTSPPATDEPMKKALALIDGATEDALIGFEFPRIAEILLDSDHRGRVLATVQDGDGGFFAVYLRNPEGYWSRIANYPDRVVQAMLGPDDAIYMVSRKNAPRGQLLRLPLPSIEASDAVPSLADARVIVPEQSDTLISEFFDAGNLCITENHLYAAYQLGGPSEIRVFDHSGKPLDQPGQPKVAAAGGLAQVGPDTVLYSIGSFVQPVTWYVHTAKPDEPADTHKLAALSTRTSADYSPYEVVRELATSKDGTKVPVNIIRRKGLTLDGSHPCVVTGYGGYGVNIEPGFDPAEIVLLEKGFVLAVANIRGGGEFGEAWHRGGNLASKQNVFDDFAAACRHMIERNYTRTDKLAIEGGSNGGLLMGATLTQHPELVRAVVSHVGIYDMLRVELSSNGAFNIPEFGTVKDPELFKAMYAYSPYHRVKDGVRYPAVLFLTGANDPRVDPMQSRKMTARLQAAVAGLDGARPVLLRTSMDTGHGAGTPLNERIAQTADVHTFLCHQLGVK